jgi:hypothetical protein
MMRLIPPEPQVGDRITAELVRELIRCIRERQLLKGPNYTLQTGPNGTYLKIDPPKAGGAGLQDNGCWKIVGSNRDEEGGTENESVQKPVRVFANQFYLTGNVVLQELELEDAVEDFVKQGEVEEGEEYSDSDRPFVCLKVPATTTSEEDPMLIGYADIGELQEAQLDPAYVVRPLYKFTHDGRIKVDLRNCPFLQVAEVLP